jgi:hypothetical protein
MEAEHNEQDPIAVICKNLAEFAVDREDIKVFVHGLPKDQGINTVTVDYELQLLKIIAVGWSLSVFMEDKPEKNRAAETFWALIRDFSRSISDVTGLMIGHDIDYFELLKERFNDYVSSMDKAIKKDDPASAIGPAFAESCKQAGNPFVTITGARIFNLSVEAVREYLQSQGLTIH